ncbi:MAG: VWA domain-containing protein [Gemmatimonadota bacterium]|nr:VWA domain-containing protein [Gemmatimonadota bacterium]MDH5760675.1 VWA domain-containing protein [Gemmatimonadota bacterium]
MKTQRKILATLMGLVLISGCNPRAPGHGVFLLIDTSGTYTEELAKARAIVNFLLGRLGPGDSFGVARIDSGSFSEKDILVRMTFDERPSVANDQKRQFKQQVDDFTSRISSSSHTDITGGMLQGVEWLNEVGPGRKTILVFSDMEEDLAAGQVRDFPIDMMGVDVIALNVTKLRSDNVDPREYLNRLQAWEARVVDGGGTWRVINDLERIEAIMDN